MDKHRLSRKFKCIDISKTPVEIHQANCLHCGNCMEICPAGAVVKRG